MMLDRTEPHKPVLIEYFKVIIATEVGGRTIMSTPASIAKHPIHPMVIPFSIALLDLLVYLTLSTHCTGAGRSGRTWPSSPWPEV